MTLLSGCVLFAVGGSSRVHTRGLRNSRAKAHLVWRWRERLPAEPRKFGGVQYTALGGALSGGQVTPEIRPLSFVLTIIIKGWE